MNLQTRLSRYARRFSFVGLAVAAVFFAASVTPSLLPRHFALQGLLSGLALAVGYGAGVAGVGLYHYLQFRDPPPNVQTGGKWITAAVVAVICLASLRQMTFWQNSIRERMEMPAVETSYPLYVLLIAIAFGALLVAAARLLIGLCIAVAAALHRILPQRVARVLGTAIVVILLLLVGEGIIARGLLTAADRIFLYADSLIDEGVTQPLRPLACGSRESRVPWDSIGRYGKNFLVDGPNEDEIAEFLPGEAMQPIRVYVGLRSRETARERAELALAELKRIGGFERSTLVIATPTGTGWLDPGGVDTVEYLLGGDTAIVSMQYSYLPSWLTLLVDPRRSTESAEVLFDVLYDHWTELPEGDRPKLYLHGLSLGALGSEASTDLITLFDDPIQGGVFSGTPFPSRQRARLTADRTPDSPAWLPTFRDGRLVRFMNQETSLDPEQPWGRMRYVYIQYASDPIVFFSPSMMYRQPEWMSGERGPDVSAHLRWYPIVTALQVGFDLPMTASVPVGYSHNYASDDYIDAWIAVTEPPAWSPQATVRLKSRFALSD